MPVLCGGWPAPPFSMIAPACADEIRGLAAEVRIAREGGRDRRADFTQRSKAAGSLEHPLHERSDTGTPAMARSRHHVVGEWSALYGPIVPDPGRKPHFPGPARGFGAGFGRRRSAREHDIAGSAHRPEVGAA